MHRIAAALTLALALALAPEVTPSEVERLVEGKGLLGPSQNRGHCFCGLKQIKLEVTEGEIQRRG